MQKYNDLVAKILREGQKSDDRTGTGTIRLFGEVVRFNLSEGFPLVNTKKTYFRGALQELLFFLKGGNNIKDLPQTIKKWWEPFTDKHGSLGDATYGQSFRHFAGTNFDSTQGLFVDQILESLIQLRDNPFGRRHIIQSWHPQRVSEQLKTKINYLPPCHMNYVQFFVQDNKLSGLFNCRSQDIFLGTPVNWAEHALLLHIFANILACEVGEYIYVGGDVHLYSNHLEQCRELLARKEFPLPTLKIKRKLSIEDLEISSFSLKEEDFELLNYQFHEPIKGEMAI